MASALERWMADYGRAWETRDVPAFVALFVDDAPYHWSPLEDPLLGRDEIAGIFRSAVSAQSNIRFTSEVLAADASAGLAHWRCTFTKLTTGQHVILDGIMQVTLDGQGLCSEFREWWHTNET